MDLYTSMVASMLFPVHERLKGHSTVRIRRRLERSQWWSADEVAAFQLHRLKQLLEDAGANVPYYRSLFAQAHFEPRSVVSLADLQHVPMLTKPIIRRSLEELSHPQARRLTKSSTGGSSGEPLTFLAGKQRISHDVAARWRAKRWWGVDMGDREVVLWGSPIELGAQDRLRLLRDRLLRSTLLSAFDMSSQNLDRFLQTIRVLRPTKLFGYPYSMAYLARHAERRGMVMNDLGIKVVFVTSEQLYQDQRETISRVFGCPVANEYGGRDAGFIAQECPHGGMHISAEDIVVEIVDEQGRQLPPGEAGEVVVTHLCSHDFPFIRYRTGDVAVLDDRRCACGRGLPMLREIQGRSNDFLKSQTGTCIPCGAFTYLIRGVRGIDSYKVVQESLERTRIQIVTGDGLDPSTVQEISRGFKRRLGERVQIDVEYVPHIPKEKSGKYRYITSKVQ